MTGFATISRRSLIEIIHLDPATIRACALGNLATANRTSPVPLTPFVVSAECRRTWTYRATQVDQDPGCAAWVTGVMWASHLSTVVGLAGFHAPPDETGMVEIGYRTDPAWRRRGFAREAVTALLERAAREPGVSTVRASVRPDNVASLAVLRPFNFTRVGQQMDDIDGLEDVYEVSVGGVSP